MLTTGMLAVLELRISEVHTHIQHDKDIYEKWRFWNIKVYSRIYSPFEGL